MKKQKRNPTTQSWNQLSNRQVQLLKVIVEEYARTSTPVASGAIMDNYFPDLSPATIRNDMAELEQFGLLEKEHSSSGRKPSLDAYRYYNSNILENQSLEVNIKKRLQAIFSNRYQAIEKVVEEALSLISEELNLPAVSSSNPHERLLKKIEFLPLSDTSGIFIIVTSDGEIIKRNVSNLDLISLRDISICIGIFNERLVDTPFHLVVDKIHQIAPIIKDQVQNFEYLFQEILYRIFQNYELPQPKVVGISKLITQPEYSSPEKLQEIMKLLEDSSTWKTIAFNQTQTGRLSISFGKDLGLPNDVAFASTSIDLPTGKTQITLMGPTRMEYAKVQSLLDFVKSEMERMWNEK